VDDVLANINELAADTGFSGAVRVDSPSSSWTAAYGLAHRGYLVANTPSTQFGTASVAKGFTALAVASLIEEGVMAFDTTARSLLGSDLPLIDDRVTIEHLLGNRSGIGDYLDEDAGGDILDYVMTRPVHQLVDAESYLPMLEGHPQKFATDTDFAYCNGGFVVLALLAERASGVSYYDLVRQRVCEPAGLTQTAFLRSDEPGSGVATHYLSEDGPRTNALHLPVRGVGDGGITTTLADLHTFWHSFSDGRIVSPTMVATLTSTRSTNCTPSRDYGLGFWLVRATGALMLQGYDAGVSACTVHLPARQVTHTVLSNTTDGAWPITIRLDELLGT
jgi:CubicO group peptidase (beta-lactamase class C family)